MLKRSQAGFGHIFVLLLVFAIAVALVAFLFSRGLINNPFAPVQKPTTTLQTQYQNPFDKNSQYSNPFAQYKNPFDTAK